MARGDALLVDLPVGDGASKTVTDLVFARKHEPGKSLNIQVMVKYGRTFVFRND